MGKLGRLGCEPAERYERARPGELIHIDVKKLGRIQGAPASASPAASASNSRTLHRRGRRAPRRRRLGLRARRHRRRHPPGLRRGPRRREGRHRDRASCAARVPSTPVTASPSSDVITDNGAAYRSTMHAIACRALGSATSAPAPTGPRPTAKPNASSAPCSAAGPTARSTRTSQERTAALDGWLWHYNHRRRHAALGRPDPDHHAEQPPRDLQLGPAGPRAQTRAARRVRRHAGQIRPARR